MEDLQKVEPVNKGIALDERGLLQPTTSSEAWKMAEIFLKSNAVPKQFENVAQVFMAIQFLKAHGINEVVGLRQTTIINGNLTIWGDLPKSLVDRSGLLEDFQEVLLDKDYNVISVENKNLHAEVYAASCVAKRKGIATPFNKSFTMDEARRAGLIDKGVWKPYPRRMIQMRARSLTLKDAFPDVLSGVSIQEYDHHDEPKNGPSIADELNRKFLSETTTDQKQETTR